MYKQGIGQNRQFERTHCELSENRNTGNCIMSSTIILSDMSWGRLLKKYLIRLLRWILIVKLRNRTPLIATLIYLCFHRRNISILWKQGSDMCSFIFGLLKLFSWIVWLATISNNMLTIFNFINDSTAISKNNSKI